MAARSRAVWAHVQPVCPAVAVIAAWWPIITEAVRRGRADGISAPASSRQLVALRSAGVRDPHRDHGTPVPVGPGLRDLGGAWEVFNQLSLVGCALRGARLLVRAIRRCSATIVRGAGERRYARGGRRARRGGGPAGGAGGPGGPRIANR